MRCNFYAVVRHMICSFSLLFFVVVVFFCLFVVFLLLFFFGGGGLRPVKIFLHILSRVNLKVGRKRDIPVKKTPEHAQAELGLSHMWPELGFRNKSFLNSITDKVPHFNLLHESEQLIWLMAYDDNYCKWFSWFYFQMFWVEKNIKVAI